jgi:hypothetical protein
MPSHFEYDSEHKILLLVFEGNLEDREILAAASNVTEQVRRIQPRAGITDFSAVTKVSVSSNAVRLAAERPSPYHEHTPIFIVAPEDHMFGLARMYGMVGHRTRSKLEIVRSRQEALASLGVPNARFEPLDNKPVDPQLD